MAARNGGDLLRAPDRPIARQNEIGAARAERSPDGVVRHSSYLIRSAASWRTELARHAHVAHESRT